MRQGLAEGGIPIGSVTFLGEEQWLMSRGVALELLQDQNCIQMMTDFIA